MSWPLFKLNVKSTWIIVVSVTLFTMIYVTASVAMYDPTSAVKMQQMFEALPDSFLKALGFDNLGSELTPYMSNYLYGFIMLVFPMIGSSILANSLVSKHEDSGSLGYLLATPNTRIKVIITQVVYLVLSMLFIFGVNVGITILICASKWSGLLDIGAYLQLNAVTVMVALTLSAVSFLAACLFREKKLSLAFGVGIPVLMFVTKMISEISEDLAVFRNFTLYSLVNIDRILGGDTDFVITVTLILLGVMLILFGIATVVFNRRNLII